MELYKGIIEDNNDPKKIGRVKVRVYGVHSDDVNMLPTNTLPWSEIIHGSSLSGSGIGMSAVPNKGTMVWVLFENNNINVPVVIGAVSGIHDKASSKKAFSDIDGVIPVSSRLNESDINRLTRNEKISETIHGTINNNLKSTSAVGRTISEPASTSNNTVYPNNRVYEDLSGNVVEVDSTAGNSRIRVYHSSGARIEFDKDGNIIVKGLKNSYNLIAGDLSEYIEKNVQSKINGLLSIEAGAITMKGDVKITGSLECTSAISAAGNIVSLSEVTDSKGNLSSLRSAYDAHTHDYQIPAHPAGTGPTATPTSVDPRAKATKFTWSGNPI